jgi:hypothetical protein
MLRYPGIIMLVLCAAAPASARSWADALFDEHAKDFGVVARGPMLTHPFRLTNNTDRPIHIANVRVSCGCVSARALQNEVAPGQSTAIQADMDTRRFQGFKKVIVYVQFDQPQWEEIGLSVQATGRDDFTVNPAGLAFGKVKPASKPATSVTVDFYGNDSLQVTGAECTGYVQTSVKEVRRDAGQVSYQVTASLRDDAPAGNWFSELWLKTNNPAMGKIRVPVTVEIEPATVTAKPTDSGTAQANQRQGRRTGNR